MKGIFLTVVSIADDSRCVNFVWSFDRETDVKLLRRFDNGQQ